jgi:hypothetical protein
MTKARDIASAAPAPAGVTSTELGYVDGVTSAIQTQVDAKIAKTLTTTTGDIIYASSANTPARLGIGSTDQVLKVSGGVPVWAAAGGGGTWTTWTPTYTNITVGNGTVTSRYLESSGTIFFEWFFDLGSTSSFGGSPTLTLPSAAKYAKGNFMCKILDAGNTFRPGDCVLNSTTVVGLQYINAVGGDGTRNSDVSSTAPQTWANGDGYYIRGFYEKA